MTTLIESIDSVLNFCKSIKECTWSVLGALYNAPTVPSNDQRTTCPGIQTKALLQLPFHALLKYSCLQQELYGLHQLYGSVVRVGPNEVSIGDHRYYRAIYTDSKMTVKDPHFYAAATFIGKDNIFQMTLVSPIHCTAIVRHA
jgi:hypothetical protein